MASLKTLAIATAFALLASGAAPEGWVLLGSRPGNYDTGIDSKAFFNDHSSAYLKSVTDTTDGFGTLMQQFSAAPYAGKRIRFSAYVQSQGVANWAGLWMRVDASVAAKNQAPRTLAFDNMAKRPIKGSTGWHRYEIVLDVPETAAGIAMGILLGGNGTVWLNSSNIEIVSLAVPTTSINQPSQPEGPRNLDFQNK